MFTQSFDLGLVARDLLRDVQLADRNLSINLRRAGIDSAALIVYRIQIKGEGSENQRLLSKAKLRVGAYSKGWAKDRTSRGRQIDHVDFTDKGDLMRSFVVLEVTDKLVTVGFLNDEQADKAEYLEAYFGEAFYLSPDEQEQVLTALANSILDDIDK
ncbi:hypothetical protein [Spirosoma oryzicola]|uniref:hypothetical protein n=1 Tax=Spirosoma oryzicola TaxID=2898794 RepID=UPI001E343CC7|nr:hypothetical protein [Spirosoma oryzicola]UHG93229.1 hypothetical protein LQ777_10090 [Spirosoma oryzicola]